MRSANPAFSISSFAPRIDLRASNTNLYNVVAAPPDISIQAAYPFFQQMKLFSSDPSRK
jgi:hypothetical protein